MENKKPKLLLHKGQTASPSMGTLGMGYTLRSLRDSGLFDIEWHDYFRTACRDYRATTVFLEGKKIYLDFWEYPTPTFTEEVYNDNYDLIIKLQWRKFTLDEFYAECQKQKYLVSKSKDEIKSFFDKIIPLSFFPSRMFEKYVNNEKSLWSNAVEIDGFFCGKDWRCRRFGKKMVLSNGMEYINSDQEIRNIISDEQFIGKMKSSKYGIVLPGRGSWATDTKNRREIDYMMMKKPILMTYAPFYYNELVPGHHYIKWEPKMKVKDIENNFDLNIVAANGYKWYLDNVSPMGLASTFLKACKERLGI